MKMGKFISLATLCTLLCSAFCDNIIGEDDGGGAGSLYTIEGKVYPPDLGSSENWQLGTVVTVNGGEFKGFLREDGSFVISSVPSGSYIVEINDNDYFYEPVSTLIDFNLPLMIHHAL